MDSLTAPPASAEDVRDRDQLLADLIASENEEGDCPDSECADDEGEDELDVDEDGSIEEGSLDSPIAGQDPGAGSGG